MGFKIYTKTGDQGQTALFGGRRVLKSDLRIDAYGTVDELNAHLGLLRDLCGDHRREIFVLISALEENVADALQRLTGQLPFSIVLPRLAGELRDLCTDQPVREQLKTIQDRLFTLGANLAADPQKELPRPDLYPADVEVLESEMDRMDANLPELRNFILPGGHPTVSQCHVARCVCRRAERLTVALAQAEPVDPIVIQYLNRLSDYLFILGRRLAADLGVEEVVWKPRG